jgi:NDP-sugar pyrophosphorylase family protein
MHALILAGGKGTRLRPLTNVRPKSLIPFVGEPFAAALLRRLAAAGAERVTFLIAQDPAPFAVLDPLAAELGLAVEAVTEERPLDTAGAVRRVLREAPHGEPVLVCNGDVLTDLDLTALVAEHRRSGAVATIALTRVEDTSAFGVVVCEADGRVRRFVEKPAPGTLADDTVNAGTYVLAPDVFDAFPGDGPLSFEREVFPGLLEAGARVQGFPSDAYWADLGTPERYLAGTRAVLEGDCRWPTAPGMAANGHSARVHRDAGVAGASLRGAVVVGRGSRVAAGAELRDTVLFEDVRVEGGATLQGAIVGEGARIGRAARVGPGVVVADGEVVPPGAVVTSAADEGRE